MSDSKKPATSNGDHRTLKMLAAIVTIVVGIAALVYYSEPLMGTFKKWIALLVPENYEVIITSPTNYKVFEWPVDVVRGTYKSSNSGYNVVVWVHEQNCDLKCAYFPSKALIKNDGTWEATHIEAGDCDTEKNQEIYAVLTDQEYPQYDPTGHRNLKFDKDWNDVLKNAKSFDVVVVKRLAVPCVQK
jgi:hypothetical protein